MRGKTSETQANREHSFMSKVFSWGYERGKVSLNPCLKVRKFTESARDRYITDQEYSAVFEFASSTLKAMMEVSFCCAARQGDVLALTHKQLVLEGIFIKQGKPARHRSKVGRRDLERRLILGKRQAYQMLPMYSRTQKAQGFLLTLYVTGMSRQKPKQLQNILTYHLILHFTTLKQNRLAIMTKVKSKNLVVTKPERKWKFITEKLQSLRVTTDTVYYEIYSE